MVQLDVVGLDVVQFGLRKLELGRVDVAGAGGNEREVRKGGKRALLIGGAELRAIDRALAVAERRENDRAAKLAQVNQVLASL